MSRFADVVGLYMDPPEKAVAVCIDEMSQIQIAGRPDLWHEDIREVP